MSISKRNAEGYYDPAAYKALTAIAKTERRAKQYHHPRIYICSPYRGDTEANVTNALRYCRFAVSQGKFPIAPHCYLPQFMDDNDPAEREQALKFGINFLYDCRELWIFGTNITAGMKREILAAKHRNIRIKQFNEKMEEL
jgi:hypothetical protein